MRVVATRFHKRDDQLWTVRFDKKNASLVRSSRVVSLSAAIVTNRPFCFRTPHDRRKVSPPTVSNTTSKSRISFSNGTALLIDNPIRAEPLDELEVVRRHCGRHMCTA